jgi:hypothetical protein
MRVNLLDGVQVFLASAGVSMQYQIVATSSFKIPYVNLVIREQAVRESSTETYNIIGEPLKM